MRALIVRNVRFQIKAYLNPQILTFLTAGWLLPLFLLSSCAPLEVMDDAEYQSYNSIGGLDLAQSFVDGSRMNYPALEISKLAERQDRQNIAYKGFPMDYNNSVKRWLNYFSKGDGRITMMNNLQRSGRYLDYMSKILESNGLPKRLVYMVMVESGFAPYRVSPKGAVGYWQFISSTAKNYDLKIDSYVDERNDFALSTHAAAQYLKHLYSLFGDWRLSMAAYNCGESCVGSAVRRYGTKNFWSLSSRKALPSETIHYVPKVMAMVRISLDPARYGFKDIDYNEPLNYSLAELDGNTTIKSVSRKLQVSPEEIKNLNPKYNTNKIIAGEDSYIRIPASSLF